LKVASSFFASSRSVTSTGTSRSPVVQAQVSQLQAEQPATDAEFKHEILNEIA
jgi:hypothetical protein